MREVVKTVVRKMSVLCRVERQPATYLDIRISAPGNAFDYPTGSRTTVTT